MAKEHYTTESSDTTSGEIETIDITVDGAVYIGTLDDDGYASGLSGPCAQFNNWDYEGIKSACLMKGWKIEHHKA